MSKTVIRGASGTKSRAFVGHPAAVTQGAPAIPPPVDLPPFFHEKPWKITLFISFVYGGWSESFYTDPIQPDMTDVAWKAFLAGRRRLLRDGTYIVAASVPWLSEKIIFDPPLGPIDVAVALPGEDQ